MFSDGAMVMGVTEGVMCQQLLQHHSQLHASRLHLARMVCSTLFKGFSNSQFLGFQKVPSVALASSSFISSFLFPYFLYLGKPYTFFFPSFFFFLFNCVKSTWSEKAKNKHSDDERVYSCVFVLSGAKDHINQKLC